MDLWVIQHHLHINKNQITLLLWSYKCWVSCMKSVQLCKLNLFFGPHLFLFSTNYIYEHMVFVRKIALYFGHIPLNKKKKKTFFRSQKHCKRRNKHKIHSDAFYSRRLYSPPRPPSNPANEFPDVGRWAEPRPRRGSGSVAASLQQENRLLGFVWWM